MRAFATIQKAASGIAVGVLAVLALLNMTLSTRAQDRGKTYPKMLPLEQYLMDRNAEIALARSAAPKAISHDATVLVLGQHGYETAVKGANGFVCMVGRAWASSIDFFDIWNPKMRGAICLNPAAAQSILPIVNKLAEMTLAGVYSEKERIAGIQEAYAKKEFPPVAPAGAMSYMMSKDAYLSHLGDHIYCHVMFFSPVRKASEWGANQPDSPVSSTSFWFPDPGKPDNPLNRDLPPLRVFVVAVPKWSNGTLAFTN